MLQASSPLDLSDLSELAEVHIGGARQDQRALTNDAPSSVHGVEMSARIRVGFLVEYSDGPGVGRIGDLDGERLRVDFFESIAEPIVDSQWLPATRCRRVMLEPETRVYWRNPDTGDWLAGRVKGRSNASYFVQFPNTEFDFPLPECELRVRWDRPVRDPVTVLAAGGNESAYFRDARLPLLRSLLGQRAASAGTFAFLSAAVEIYPHQINTALTVLSDPVQRYLLADEVGLGKTIEAGFVIRQTMLDQPHARIAVLTPDVLRLQWVQELREKFFIDDFPEAQVKCVAHETPERWPTYHGCELVVVDEAHRLAQTDDPQNPTYRSLCALAHSAPRLLLLSATPAMSQHSTQLGMLHLLDPEIYRWTDRAAFERRYELRSKLADAIYGLDADYTYLLPPTIARLRALLPEGDDRFAKLSNSVLELLNEDDELDPGAAPNELHYRIEELRAHISETYRLHRRVIRHRRDRVLRSDPDSEEMPYEVTGRKVPQWLPLSIDNQDAARQMLLDWQSMVWDNLLDEQRAEEADAYGLALAVFVSRGDGLADDLACALRWRLDRDGIAADRAGLSKLERQVLIAPKLLPAENNIFEAFEARMSAGREPSAEMDSLVSAMLPALRSSNRTVVFCGPGNLASDVAARLRARFPRVGVHEHTRLVGSAGSENSALTWSHPTRQSGDHQVLVADDTAEDGLNLQMADAVIHLRLPWSPNQLEQRLGRVDRYPTNTTAILSSAASQFLIGCAEADEYFSEAWARLLIDGYQIFSGSLSTLQDTIAAGLGETWTTGLKGGPPGLIDHGASIRADLTAARQEIDKMDMLESIHETATEGRNITAALIRVEQEWRTTRDTLMRYTSDDSGGIKLRHHDRTVDGCRRTIFDLRQSQPLLAPRQWKGALKRVNSGMAQGSFNRSAALRAPGTRLLRRGNPLVDVLAAAIAIDDRGQASAIQRTDPHYDGDPEPYFGFDFLVEADIAQALMLVTGLADAARALRRQADRILAPFTLQVWIGMDSNQPLTDPDMLTWLGRPYDKRNGDRNYGRERHSQLIAIFGGWDHFWRTAEASETTCRKHLAEVTDLERKCAEARHEAQQRIAIISAQARARQAAGHLVGDAESYLLQASVTDALVEGLSSPKIRPVAATCLIRTAGRIRRDD